MEKVCESGILPVMEPTYQKKTDDYELGCYIDDQGVIRLRMNGNLSNDHGEAVAKWAEAVRAAMRTAKEHDPEHVYCLIDVSGKGIVADQDAMSVLIGLMHHNRDYVTRTGVFGSSFLTRNLIDIALKATRRKNMRTFGTLEEAERWVFGR